MRRVLGLGSALLAGALAFFAAGCPRSEAPRVAFVGSYRAAEGALLSQRAVQASGGIEGQPLELSIRYDNGGSGARAIADAEALVADPTVLAVVGHSSSKTTLAAAESYNRAGVVQLAPTSSAPVYVLAGPYSFRLVPSDENQAAFLARQLPV
ncbi:MAG TPA: ABC transporter substrate-binding protein, partial [Longimicrobiales bacterium]